MMMLGFWRSLSVALLVIVMSCQSLLAEEATPAVSSPGAAAATASAAGTSLRGHRYCELLVPTRDASSGKMTLRVYNTQGLNDCPEAAWDAIDPGAEARRLGVPQVIKNGPRYLAYDRISAEIDGSAETFGDLDARVVATLEIPAGTLPQEGPAYRDMIVDRATEYIYLAGKPVFELVAADGSVYIMQTYLAHNDPEGDLSGLGDLRDRLALPAGWTFRVVAPDQDLYAVANGQATVLRDDLENTYQLLSRGDGTPVPTS
jgi:hypothetical protein